jgi:hypothetical protein
MNTLLHERSSAVVTHRNPRSNFLDCAFLACFLAIVGGVLLPTPVRADVIVAAFADVNPDMSSLDAGGDPDGSSGGRCNGLASVPGNNQIFYVASEKGGLYRTTDAGLSWSHLDGHVPQATWDVEVDPANANKIYATSFYDGRLNPITGIQVSSDGGVTWTHPPTAHPDPTLEGTPNDNTPQVGFGCANGNDRTQPSAFGIGIRPDAPNNIFVGTSCGIAISRDGGATWEFRDPNTADGVGNAARVWDVVVQGGGPTGQGIVDICGDEGHFRSTDGGLTWTTGVGLPGGRSSIAVSPDESYVLFVAAADNNIYESDDAGANWTNLGTPDSRGQGRIPFVAVNDRAGTAFDLWYGDVSLFRGGCTTPAVPAPGGANRCPAGRAVPASPPPAGWAGPFTRSAGGHDDVGDIVFDPTVAIDACPMLFSCDGGVYRNTDLGADCQNPNWEQPNRTPHALWEYGMTGVNQSGDTSEDLYFACQDNGSFGTIDLGNTNPTWNNADCCDVFDFAADANRALDPIGFFLTPPNFRLKLAGRGLVGGGTLSPANSPPGNLITFQFPEAVANFGDKQYVVVTSSGVFITTDVTAGTIVWTQLGAATDPGGCAVQVSMSGSTPTFYLQVGCNPDIGGHQIWKFTGTNPTDAWVRIDANAGQTGGVNIFAADPTDPNRLYACNTAPAGPRMVFSTDGGLNWNGNPQLDTLMTGGGIFRYRNERGPTDFTAFSGYFEPSLLAFDPENPQIVVAGGRDSGVFLSPDGGGRWALLTDPFTPGVSGIPHLSRPRFAYFDHEPADGKVRIYIGTEGRGVWRITVPCTLTCPANITQNNAAGLCGATVNYPAPTTSGDCGIVTCSPPSGSFFAVGTTTVTCTSATGSSCTFNVIVNDTEPPKINCPSDITMCNDPGQCSAKVSFNVTATDNCAVQSLVCTPPSGSIFSKGTNTVTCVATDTSGNTTSCSFNVIVNDCEPPKVTSSVATASLWPPNHDLINVGLAATATDNCPGPIAISVQVFSDESEDAPGDTHFSPDAKDIAPGTLRLRSERFGHSDGRVYLIVTTATDTSGNKGHSCATVVVPHDQSAASIASVNAQAAAASAFCQAHDGSVPPGFVMIGIGPVIGPKQ